MITETYKPGGLGSINGGGDGNTSALVTISGRVMSTATFNASSGSFLGMQARKNYISKSEADNLLTWPALPLAGQCTSTDPCRNATWSLQYLGSTSIVASGASSCEEFSIPSVPEGKEGVVTFTCEGNKTQRCIVKAGDTGLNCNAIADAVVETVEATVDGSMLDPAMYGKVLAKVATAIVETTNNDNTESEELNSSIQACKNAASDSLRKLCYKNALLSSSQSSTLNVVKTLAQTWTVRNLFNFLVGTAYFSISSDDFVFTKFGAELDNWASSDFIAKTREYVLDLVNNPDYVGGDPANGEQVAKIECRVWYNKYQSGGQAVYKPTLVTNSDGILQPSCLSKKEIALITGLDENSTKISDYFVFSANKNGNNSYQIGDAKDNTNAPLSCNNSSWNIPDSFCLGKPELKFTSRFLEPDRNDLTGENKRYVPENRVSLINVSDLAMAKLMEIDALSRVDGPLKDCFLVDNNGPPTMNIANTNCKNKLQLEMSKLRNELTGMMGLYNYVNYPSRFVSNGSTKLSLQDIHKAFSRRDFSNSQLVSISGGDFWSRQVASTGSNNIWIYPTADFSGTNPFFSTIFQASANNYDTSSSIDKTTFYSIVDNGSLYNKYNLTFKLFEKIPLLSDIQASIQSASHHESYNPYGSKYTYAVARKKPKDGSGNTIYNAPDFPVFCRLVNKLNDQPMLKELNPDTKIECIPDPTDTTKNPMLTNGATTVDSQDSAKFNNMPAGYPFVLQDRGYNGENYGRVYVLADRKTGLSLRLGGDEVYIVEAKSSNDSNFVIENGPCTPTISGGVNVANPSTNGNIVKVKMFYGQGSNSRNDIQKAFCLNMSSIIATDNDTRLFWGGNLNITNTQNGSSYSYSMLLVGGRNLNDSSSYIFKPMCWFTANSYFEVDKINSMYGQSKYTTTSSYPIAPSSIPIYTDSWSNTFKVVGPQGGDVVDYCENSSNYSNTLKNQYYLTFFPDYSFVDVTTSRSNKPIGIYSDTDKNNFYGISTNIGLIEAKLASALTTNPVSTKIANISSVSYSNSLKLLNLKHNSKYDPFCDDLNGDGKCNCKDSSGNPATNRECTLADDVTEPTMSNPPFWANSSDAKKYADFFSTYGGLSGANPSDQVLLSNVDQKYLNDNKIYLDYQSVFKCAYKQGTNTEPGSPNYLHSGKFSNTHFSGCPAADGDIPMPVTTDNNNVGTDGGGPIRIIKPIFMNNAYDIARPRKLLNMIQYATKSVGQGVTIDLTKKVFSFDEALALVQVRYELPPRDVKVRIGNSNGSVYNETSLIFTPQRICENGDSDIVTSLLTILVHPESLNTVEPSASQVNCSN